MYRIGLTGGTGSGKSEVARILGGLGAHVLVADEIAREQVAPGSPLLDELVSEFGSGILRDDGALDRRRLGREVFGDAARLERLNAITRPPLVRAIVERMEELERSDPAGVAVLDAALLLDWDMADAFDVVVAVVAPPAVRVARLVAGGLEESEARSRMDAQMPDSGYAASADEVIENAGTLGQLRARVLGLWRRVDSDREGGVR